MVPAAGPCRGRGAGLAPRRTRSGPHNGVVPGRSLRRRSWAACAAVVWLVMTWSLTRPVSRTVSRSTGDCADAPGLFCLDADTSPFWLEDATPGSRACVRVPALLGRVRRAGLPGAFWCDSPLLWPFCPSALLGLLRVRGALVVFFISFLFLLFFFFPSVARAPVVSGFLCFPAPGALGLGPLGLLLPSPPPACGLSFFWFLFSCFAFPPSVSPHPSPPFVPLPLPPSLLFVFSFVGAFLAFFPSRGCVYSCVAVVPCVWFCWCAGVCRLCPAVLLCCPCCLPRLLAVRRCLPCCALRLCPHPPPSPRPLCLLLCGRLCPLLLLCLVGAPSRLLPPWLCSVLSRVRVVLRLLALWRGVVCPWCGAPCGVTPSPRAVALGVLWCGAPCCVAACPLSWYMFCCVVLCRPARCLGSRSALSCRAVGVSFYCWVVARCVVFPAVVLCHGALLRAVWCLCFVVVPRPLLLLVFCGAFRPLPCCHGPLSTVLCGSRCFSVLWCA